MISPKSYCYKSNCSIVITGFHLNQYFVCSHCKEEVSESLKKQVEDRESKKDEPTSDEFEDPESYLWKL